MQRSQGTCGFSPSSVRSSTSTRVDRKTCTEMQNNNSLFFFFLFLFSLPSRTLLQMINSVRIVVFSTLNFMCGDAAFLIRLLVNLYVVRFGRGVEINVWTVRVLTILAKRILAIRLSSSLVRTRITAVQCSLSSFRLCYSCRWTDERRPRSRVSVNFIVFIIKLENDAFFHRRSGQRIWNSFFSIDRLRCSIG